MQAVHRIIFFQKCFKSVKYIIITRNPMDPEDVLWPGKRENSCRPRAFIVGQSIEKIGVKIKKVICIGIMLSMKIHTLKLKKIQKRRIQIYLYVYIYLCTCEGERGEKKNRTGGRIREKKNFRLWCVNVILLLPAWSLAVVIIINCINIVCIFRYINNVPWPRTPSYLI